MHNEYKNKPLISVILPVYNCERYIGLAIQSVLCQSFRDFELIVINDGSTDSTGLVIDGFSDPRIKKIEIENGGLVKALNLGVSNSNGDYIARMDADDICMPMRFEMQVNELSNNPKLDVICSDIIKIDEQGSVLGEEVDLKFSGDGIRNFMLFKTGGKPIVHPTVMMKKALLDAVNGYRNFNACEDRDLWLRCLDSVNVLRINVPLLKYRITNSGISISSSRKQILNGIIAVIVHETAKRTGVDIYDTEETMYKNIKSEIESDLETSYIQIISDVRELKRSIKSKNYRSVLGGVWKLKMSVIYVIPLFQRKLARKVIEKYNDKLALLLNCEKRS
jgi:glycosyltransferase involved in cell wall biosynthesis